MNYNQPAGVSNYLSLAKERPYAYAGEDIVMVSGMNTAQIDGSGLKPATATMYWDPIENLSCSDCFDPIFYYDSPYGTQGKFVLTIDNGPGCISTDTMEIVYWRKKVFIQNAFTPNEDDINNVFTPVLLENEEMLELVVFNRWGELVYQGVEGWDGTFSGKPAPQGVYVYRMIINQTLLDGFVPRAIKQGDLTLLR
jgi:gliding motility-associated-like protein